MKVDRLTKALLALIAIGLWLNAVTPFFHSRPVRAMDTFRCDGKVKVMTYGATEPSIGGYDVDVRCH